MSRALALLPLFAVTQVVAAPLADGPYVSRSASGAWVARWIEGDESTPHVRESAIAAGGEVTVPGVGAVPAFKVKL